MHEIKQQRKYSVLVEATHFEPVTTSLAICSGEWAKPVGSLVKVFFFRVFDPWNIRKRNTKI